MSTLETSKSNGSEVQGETVTIETLSKMSGVPLDFIKKELLINEDTISIEGLREVMLQQLDSTFSNNN